MFGRRIFVFVFKQYENNFQKIEIETSFQIIVFKLCVWVPFLKTIFKILKTKNDDWETISIFDIKKKKFTKSNM